MDQQINLYQACFQKQYLAFSFSTSALILTLILFAMAASFGYGHWQRGQLAGDLETLQQQKSFLEQRLATLQKQMPTPVVSQLLEQKLQQLLENYSNGHGLLQRVRSLIAGNRYGFSAYLEGLARQVEAGVWLTDIEIAGAGSFLSLQGSVTQPELVPQLLQKLSQEEIFRGKAFEVMDLSRPDANKGQVDFALLTTETER